jgi:hypothetical protein
MLCYLIGMFWLIGLMAVSCGSLLILINALRKAPEAFESEDGFHILKSRPTRAGILRGKKSPIGSRQARGREATPGLRSSVPQS